MNIFFWRRARTRGLFQLKLSSSPFSLPPPLLLLLFIVYRRTVERGTGQLFLQENGETLNGINADESATVEIIHKSHVHIVVGFQEKFHKGQPPTKYLALFDSGLQVYLNIIIESRNFGILRFELWISCLYACLDATLCANPNSISLFDRIIKLAFYVTGLLCVSWLSNFPPDHQFVYTLYKRWFVFYKRIKTYEKRPNGSFWENTIFLLNTRTNIYKYVDVYFLEGYFSRKIFDGIKGFSWLKFSWRYFQKGYYYSTPFPWV